MPVGLVYDFSKTSQAQVGPGIDVVPIYANSRTQQRPNHYKLTFQVGSRSGLVLTFAPSNYTKNKKIKNYTLVNLNWTLDDSLR